MPPPDSNPQTPVAPPPAPRTRFDRLIAWTSVCAVDGAAAAWLAVGVERVFSPLILFPALVGAVLGVTLVGLFRLMQVAGRPMLLGGCLLAGTVAVAGEHYFSYRTHREAAEEQAKTFRKAETLLPGLVRGSVPRPAENLGQFLRWQALRGRPIAGGYVARGGWAWASWALDALITLAAALAIVWPAARQPYCDRCRSWYRTTRRGRISVPLARQVAKLAAMKAIDHATGAQYRVVRCDGGCGPVGFELSWKMAGGRSTVARTWVSLGERDQIATWLDAGTVPAVDPPPPEATAESTEAETRNQRDGGE